MLWRQVHTSWKHVDGWNVAHSGQKAIETIRSDESVNLVLMDIDLGSGISGVDSAEQILSIRHVFGERVRRSSELDVLTTGE